MTSKQVLFAYPQGTRDATGKNYWNDGNNVCCDFLRSGNLII